MRWRDRFNLANIAFGGLSALIFVLGGNMKKTVVGMLALSAMAVAMGSAFAQETAKAAPEMTAAEKDQAKKDLLRALCWLSRCAAQRRHRQEP
jgi:uncharacterized membrane protein